MHLKYRIINVDESVISLSELSRSSWQIKGVKNKITSGKRPNRVNVIAGISNYGEVFYTINHGPTNANTFLLFIIKLCEYLYTVDRQWRSNTIIMIDNASYHKGKTITNDF